jgi:phosphoglycolate phosphatase-like HAD superfamily hydrolase
VFDLDGTLTRPGAIDFARLRARLALQPGEDILGHTAALPTPAQRAAAHAIIAEEEELGLARVEAMAGAAELCAFFPQRPPPLLRTGVLTRNSERVMERTLAALALPHAFDLTLSRDWPGGPPKPHPAALLHMAAAWGLAPADCVMVGDHSDDLLAGRAAGFTTVLIGEDREARAHADHCITSLAELLPLLA